jgi:hypothetical protein
MERPCYTARRHEALYIVRAADGALELGCGRIKIARGAVAYFRRVAAAFADALDLPGCPEALERGDALGRAITIMQPDVPTVPPNAWTIPDALRAAVTPGVGCGSTIVYDPDDWAREGDPCCPAAHEVLLRLLLQANACAAGECTPPAGRETVAVLQPEPVRLVCRPSKIDDVLCFPCVIPKRQPGRYLRDGGHGRRRSFDTACVRYQARGGPDRTGRRRIHRNVHPPETS